MRGSCGTGVNKVFLNRFITKKEIKLIQDLNRLNVLRPKEIIKRPYYLESPMVWSETRGKWYVINETGNWLEFIGKEEDIEWRIVK